MIKNNRDFEVHFKSTAFMKNIDIIIVISDNYRYRIETQMLSITQP